MWKNPFRDAAGLEKAHSESISERFERLESSVRSLKDEIAALERQSKSMKLEWEEAYDKLHHLMARITKRAKTRAAEADDDAVEPPQPALSGMRPAGDSDPASRVLGTHDTLQRMRNRFMRG